MNKYGVIALACMLLIIFSVLAVPAFITMPAGGYATPSPEWHEALSWIKGNTPEDARILTWWDYGYWIEYTALRTPLVTPSQEVEDVRSVARYLCSFDNPEPPGGASFILVDKPITGIYMPAIFHWADLKYEKSSIPRTLAYRLFTTPDPAGYTLEFDNGLKILKYAGTTR